MLDQREEPAFLTSQASVRRRFALPTKADRASAVERLVVEV